ncbi:hypothetical protein CIRMBP1308_02098 [Enterococcus cecorum]|nr:hypothetical protein CIRMBP1308_02098 [Enterococcus cecorum]
MAKIISFPNQSANARVTAELMDDILHTSLELEIY